MNSERLKAFVRLTRPLNVAITAVSVPAASVLAGGGAADRLHILLGTLAAMFVQVGANAINDYFDIEIDRVNRPDRPLPAGILTPADAWYVWSASSVLAVVLSLAVNALSFAIVCVSVGILYLYSARLKPTMLMGNAVVGMQTGLAFIYGGGIVGNPAWGIMPFIFAFLVNMAREIVKDVQDANGDRKHGARTFPIRYGVVPALSVATAFLILLIGSTVAAQMLHLYSGWFLAIVLVVDVAVAGSIVVFWRDRTAAGMGRASRLLRYCMMGGLVAIVAGSL